MSLYGRFIFSRTHTFACSTEEGIFASSSAFENDQPMCVYVYVTPEGKIESKKLNQSLAIEHDEWKEKNSDEDEFVEKAANFFQVFLTCLIAIPAIMGSMPVTIICSVFWILSIFTGLLNNLSLYFAIAAYHFKHPSLSRFHAAEHMAFQAYEKFDRLPTIEEIAECNKYDGACTTVDSLLLPTLTSFINNILLTIAFVCIMFSFIYVVNNLSNTFVYYLFFPCLVLIIFMLKEVVERVGPFLAKGFEKGYLTPLMQWAVVSRPSPLELQVAHEAIRQKIILDNTIRENPDKYEFADVDFSVKDKKAVYTFKDGDIAKVTIHEYIDGLIAIINAQELDDENAPDEIAKNDIES